ncbi:hypothetical protein BDF21DRAFT_400953 [Thamnidium elegans]|nr:hypothetical protein BDF21DRAFT_400953 [Thamnidium elegans]
MSTLACYFHTNKDRFRRQKNNDEAKYTTFTLLQINIRIKIVPTRGIVFRRLLAKNHFQVFLIDEFRTRIINRINIAILFDTAQTLFISKYRQNKTNFCFRLTRPLSDQILNKVQWCLWFTVDSGSYK